MRAHERASGALDADAGIPARNLRGDVALLPLSCGSGPSAIVRHGAHRQVVALLRDDLGSNLLDEHRRFGGHDRRHFLISGRLGGILDFENGIARGVYGVPVALDDIVALPPVSLLGVFLELLPFQALGFQN